jgi:hypothetical protein
MALDLRFIRIASEEVMDDVERMRDVELADLFAAVFGTWSFIISVTFVLYTGDMAGLFTGILPSQFIALAAGINLYLERHGIGGWEAMNLIAIFASLWMMFVSALFPSHAIMEFSNTFSAMWIGLASAYASFLRQNNPHRETIIQIRMPLM